MRGWRQSATSQNVHAQKEMQKASFQHPGDFSTVNITLMISITSSSPNRAARPSPRPEWPILSGNITGVLAASALYSRELVAPNWATRKLKKGHSPQKGPAPSSGQERDQNKFHANSTPDPSAFAPCSAVSCRDRWPKHPINMPFVEILPDGATPSGRACPGERYQ